MSNKTKVIVEDGIGTMYFNSISDFCKYYNLSAQTIYRWLTRNPDKCKRTIPVNYIDVYFDRGEE